MSKGQLTWRSNDDVKVGGMFGPFQCSFKGSLNAEGFESGKCEVRNMKGDLVKTIEGSLNTPFSSGAQSAAGTPQKASDEETKQQTPMKGSAAKSSKQSTPASAAKQPSSEQKQIA
jgi:hypothetical protein